MVLAMAGRYPPSKQRPALLAFAAALNSSPMALRRDGCGDWSVNGRHGHVYAIPGTLDEPGREGFLLYCADGSVRRWGATKKALGFARVTQDGAEEGLFFLDRLPTAAEAEVIRDRLGVRKRRDISDEQRAALRERLLRGFQPEKLPADAAGGVSAGEDLR